MNLPFTPASFRKLDILQQLMEYESHKKEKSLWNGVKALLIWAASEHHVHLGSFLGPNHVKSALQHSEFFSEEERKRLVDSCAHILESLTVYGFGEQGPSPDPKQPSVKINRNGVLAGRILVETNFLKNTWWRYQIWVFVWWLILVVAAIILISQTITAAKSIFNTVVPTQARVTISHEKFHRYQYYLK